jgi:serine-type D-Ala-D-Ala carboxypeptidase/endopeptidase (penicillin-binding protein 4)
MRIIIYLIYVFVLFGCSSVHKTVLRDLRASEAAFKDYTGFHLYDLEKKKSIISFNGDRYFTPASNTKILTLYACLTILGDSLPTLRYYQTNDSLVFWGVGDPSFLNPFVFDNRASYNFLKNASQSLYYSSANFYANRFGDGWAWDDYSGDYQPEIYAFPIYSNLLKASVIKNEISLTPQLFSSSVIVLPQKSEQDFFRDERTNTFFYQPSSKLAEQKYYVPFITNDSLFRRILTDTLGRDVRQSTKRFVKEASSLYSVPVDSVYKVLMQDSDNFLAEQLLLVCASVLSDSLSPEPTIQFMQRNYLSTLPDLVKWVDGSGLSRYNLVTPRSIVDVWKRIYEKVPSTRLFPLLATGGTTGTIRSWYKAESPYVFGKTGTLSNNHCLSGYLITKSNKTLIFSFMNSNYLTSTSAIRKNMQTILEYVRDNY